MFEFVFIYNYLYIYFLDLFICLRLYSYIIFICCTYVYIYILYGHFVWNIMAIVGWNIEKITNLTIKHGKYDSYDYQTWGFHAVSPADIGI